MWGATLALWSPSMPCSLAQSKPCQEQGWGIPLPLPLLTCTCSGADPGVLGTVLEGHTDAVWGLAFCPTRGRLVSCSADGTIRLWDPSGSPSCLSTYSADSGA